jgi:nucleoside-diphosphate-sugar epimerase
MNKKVLITGGAGFIGLHLANRLLDEGCQVHLVDNFSRAVDDVELKTTLARKMASFNSIDLLEIDNVEQLDVDYDFIFHLAAIIGVKHVMKRPYDVLYDNIRMLGNMMNLVHKQNSLSRFFFASTSEIYSGTLKYFDLPIPTPEKTPLAITDLAHPRTSYMLSKIYGEALCQQASIPFTLFRPHNIFGPRMGMAHVIPEQLRKAYEAQEGDNIEVFSIDHTRCFCYIDDAIEMLWRMMESPKCEGETLNLGTQNPEISIKEVAEACFLAADKKLSIDAKPASPGSPTRRGPDMSKTISLIDYESQVSFIDGIARTYDWYKKNIFEGKVDTAK